jgi:DNA (cytosine-5)-methyltransferase 1
LTHGRNKERKTNMRTMVTVDLFCGAGGASTGMGLAFEKLGLKNKNYCVNHWDVAIATHSANHPDDIHRCAPVETIIPDEFVKEGYIDLLWASPSCTHHSRASGKKPKSNQLRAQPNMILDWLDMINVKRLIIENVPEFMEWGPLTANGHAVKSKKGECFRAFLQSLEARNYKYEYRVLNCADFGDVTTRERFFLQAVKRGYGKLAWPSATHCEDPQPDMFENREKWRGIGECLDWSDLGTPLSQRKKQLAPATMARIMEGIKKFCGQEFIVDFLGSDKPKDTSRVKGVDKPIGVQHCSNRFGLARPFLVDFANGGKTKPIDKPMPTLTTKNSMCLCTPFIVDYLKNMPPFSTDDPIRAQHCKGRFSLATPFIVKWETNSKPSQIDKPISTQTSFGKFNLCTPVTDGKFIVDVCFRMLKPDELKKATGFPDDYVLTGGCAAQVKQIGNAVPVNTAMNLCMSSVKQLIA